MLRPRDPCSAEVSRGFVELTHGRLHYRTAGTGPVVVALHASPSSSVSLLPVLEALAARYTVIAPDTPGYGLSDPLPDEHPTLEEFADALAQMLEVLGLHRVALYGTHTGAAISAMFAARYPMRVSRLVLDGVSAFTATEIESFRTSYLEPYAPHWDGRHVMSLWSRTRDLYTWFPWHDRSADRRLAFEPPALPVLDRSALGFLQAGAHYQKAYIRAAELQPAALLRQVKAPILLMTRKTDLIADHLDRIGPDRLWEVRLVNDDEEWRGQLAEAFASGDEEPQVSIQFSGSSFNVDGGFLKLGEGWLNIYAAGPADGPLRLCLPDFPGDASALADRESAARPMDRILAIDLPGCGWSDPLADAEGDLEHIIDALERTLDILGLSLAETVVVAQGASAVLGRVWQARSTAQGYPPFQLDLRNAPAWLYDPAALPQTAPLTWAGSRWDGTHLTGAWMQLRDRLMYETPPGSGSPMRAQGAASGVTVDLLDRLFRLYI